MKIFRPVRKYINASNEKFPKKFSIQLYRPDLSFVKTMKKQQEGSNVPLLMLPNTKSVTNRKTDTREMLVMYVHKKNDSVEQ